MYNLFQVFQVCHFLVSWPTVSLMKIAAQWRCTSCCVLPPFRVVWSQWEWWARTADQLHPFLPQCSEKPNFCIQGQQRYLGPQNSKWTLLSRMSGATEEIISPFCLWIKTCKISLKCVLSNAFLYVFFFPLNIFLMSSAAFKDFINLKKERKIKIPLLFFEALVLYLFEGDLESGKAEVGRVMSVLFSDVLVIH